MKLYKKYMKLYVVTRMKKTYHNIIIVIQTLAFIEFVGVAVWALLSKSLDIIPVNIVMISLCIGYLIFIFRIILFKNARRNFISDERIEKNFERSYMFGGVAGILVLLQIAIIEIITGITFSTIAILYVVGIIFYITMISTGIIHIYYTR